MKSNDLTLFLAQPVASAYDGTTDYKSGSTTGAATTGAIGIYLIK